MESSPKKFLDQMRDALLVKYYTRDTERVNDLRQLILEFGEYWIIISQPLLLLNHTFFLLRLRF
jgi:hypothetical protein